MDEKILYSKKFLKNFRKRIASNRKLSIRFNQRLMLFSKNSSSSVLADHQLTGDKNGYRSFSITGNVRVIYARYSKTEIIFLDIGTHNQVY